MTRSKTAPTPIRFGGESSPRSGQPDLAGLDDLFKVLSWKYTTDDAVFDTSYTPPAKGETEALKSEIAAWAGRVWIHNNEIPSGQKLREFDILSLEDEYRRYIARHGADLFKNGMTIEETWASHQLYHACPAVLMIAEAYAGDLDRVDPKRICKTDKLVWLVAAICLAFGFRGPELNILVSDGRSGHTIRMANLNGFDFVHPRGVPVKAGWFSFHDPWPARSLLAEERNFKGVRALEDVSRPPLWLISPEDLDRVIVGFSILIDMLPFLGPVFRILDTLQGIRSMDSVVADKKGAERPMWIEDADRPDEPFAMLLEGRKDLSSIAVDGMLGLGQMELLTGKVDVALGWFERTYEIDPAKAVHHASKYLANFGHAELAAKWAKRAPREAGNNGKRSPRI